MCYFHALGLTAIAEGVETRDEWDLLNALGCDGAQGWHVARPMPQAQATEWIRGRVDVRQIYPRPGLVERRQLESQKRPA